MKRQSKLIKVILAFALIIGAFSFNSSFAAGQDVEINETNFPDATFREYVKRFDNNRNGKLSTSEINVVKNIDVSEKNIKSIKGVEFFADLEELECVKNKISDINVSKNTKLKKLNCEWNELNTLDVTKNIALNELRCGINNLTTLDLKNNKNLKVLWCYTNRLKNLDISQNTSLREVFCAKNEISNLDLSKNTELKVLDIGENYLEKLDLSNNIKLEKLKIYTNKFKNIDISNNLELGELDCQENLIENINLKNNKKLYYLDCSNNKLKTLDLSNNGGLMSLLISKNQFKDINISLLKELSIFQCDKNKLTSLYTSNNPRLTNFYGLNQTYDISINRKDNSFDITKLPGKFDKSKVHNLKSAVIKGNKLIVNKKAKKVTYDYKTSDYVKFNVTLNVKLSDKPDKVDKNRIAGSDRIATAIEVSKKYYKTADTVIIARSDMYPDSLTASPLAKALEAPILLTQKDELDDRVMDEIARLGVKNVIIVGGESSINSAVESLLFKYDKDHEIERIAGKNRSETSAALATKLIEVAGNKNTAIIASGENFADALTAGAFASEKSYPILLVQKTSIDSSVTKVIEANKINKTCIAGGLNSVSSKVQKQLPKDTQRIAGADRYETAVKIAEELFEGKQAFVASGEVFADALVVSPVAGGQSSPILLVSRNELPKSVKDYVAKNIKQITVVGGEKYVPQENVDSLKNLIK